MGSVLDAGRFSSTRSRVWIRWSQRWAFDEDLVLTHDRDREERYRRTNPVVAMKRIRMMKGREIYRGTKGERTMRTMRRGTI
jgi:hypothetical protein